MSNESEQTKNQLIKQLIEDNEKLTEKFNTLKIELNKVNSKLNEMTLIAKTALRGLSEKGELL